MKSYLLIRIYACLFHSFGSSSCSSSSSSCWKMATMMTTTTAMATTATVLFIRSLLNRMAPGTLEGYYSSVIITYLYAILVHIDMRMLLIFEGICVCLFSPTASIDVFMFIFLSMCI